MGSKPAPRADYRKLDLKSSIFVTSLALSLSTASSATKAPIAHSCGARQSKLQGLRSYWNRSQMDEQQQMHVLTSDGGHHGDATSSRSIRRSWWKIKWFHGVTNDIRRRAPFYWSDWSDAWDYRVVPATVYMYFVSRAHPYTDQDIHLDRALTDAPTHRQSMVPQSHVADCFWRCSLHEMFSNIILSSTVLSDMFLE